MDGDTVELECEGMGKLLKLIVERYRRLHEHVCHLGERHGNVSTAINVPQPFKDLAHETRLRMPFRPERCLDS